MKRAVILLAVVCLLGAACSDVLDPAMTPSPTVDGGYLVRVMDTPTTFDVPKDKAEEAWSRVNVFIVKYSSMKIQIATNFAVETYNPITNSQFGYSASRVSKGDAWEFSVVCIGDGSIFKNSITRNAHVLAYYALTGELIERYIKR